MPLISFVVQTQFMRNNAGLKYLFEKVFTDENILYAREKALEYYDCAVNVLEGEGEILRDGNVKIYYKNPENYDGGIKLLMRVNRTFFTKNIFDKAGQKYLLKGHFEMNAERKRHIKFGEMMQKKYFVELGIREPSTMDIKNHTQCRALEQTAELRKLRKLTTEEAEFIKFRATHVAYAGLSKEERAKMDETPPCWVKGHILRSDLFGAMDGIAAGLSKVDAMPDTADWLALFAPVKAVKAPSAKHAETEKPRLSPSTATFPALGSAPKSAPATAPATSGDVFTGLSLVDALETIEAALKAGTMPGDFALRLDRALKGYYTAVAPATAPAPATATATAPAPATATATAPAVKGSGNKKQVKAALDVFFTESVQTAH